MTSKVTMMVAVPLVSLLAACGGGAGGSASSGGAINNLNGSIVKGPVNGATVCAYALLATGKGPQIGCTTTRADGFYSFDLTYVGPVVVEATGGSYTDEATGVPGVALSTPLTTVGMIGGGAKTLIATPLTTIGFKQAVSGNSLTVQGFEAANTQVKSAFGLGAEVDLARTMPNVVTGQTNAYGSALVGVSKMLNAGASLSGIVSTTDVAGLGSSYQRCSDAPTNASVDLQVKLSPDVLATGAATVIDVTGPYATWRATLPASGRVNQSACTVSVNTPTQVRLSCAQTTGWGNVQIYAGGSASSRIFQAAPLSNELPVIAGDKVVFSGGDMRIGALTSISIEGGTGTVKALELGGGAGNMLSINSPMAIVGTCQLLSSGALVTSSALIPTGGGINLNSGSSSASTTTGGTGSTSTGGSIVITGTGGINTSSTGSGSSGGITVTTGP